jgi:signal transduction histidine kinase
LQYAQVAAKLGFYDWDVETGRVTWSPEIPSLRGLVPDGDVNKWRAHIHPDDLPSMDAKARQAQPSDQIELEYRIVKPDRSIVWLLSRGRRIYDENGKPAHSVGVAMDVTERKLAEQALQTAEMLAAAGRLAATIAHEINNPLESVTNLIFLAKHHPGVPADARRDLELADQELSRVTYLAQQTLGFYRDSSHPEAVAIGDVIQEVLRLYERKLAYKKVGVSLAVDPTARVVGTGGEIRQVLANVISNAIDASPNGSELVVRAVPGHHWQSLRPGVRIAIADRGHGIPRAVAKRIYDPFFTTKKEVGTGLGLWVTRNIVERHGGSIRFRSSTQPGRCGTVFSIYLADQDLPGGAAAWKQ